MLNNLYGYNKIKHLLSDRSLSSFSYVKSITINYDYNYIDDIIFRDISIIIQQDLVLSKGISFILKNVKQAIIPDGLPLQVSQLEIEDFSSRGWESCNYRLFNAEQDNDFEILAEEIELELYESKKNFD